MNIIKIQKLHLLLHCLVVLSLNLEAIIAQLHVIIEMKINLVLHMSMKTKKSLVNTN